MGAAYTAQLDRLKHTVQRVAGESFDDLRAALEAVAPCQALFVGTGGALAVAQLAADLHEHRAGMVARAVTPLEFLARPATPQTAAVMFSASAKHPDARAAIALLDGGPYAPTAIITHRAANAVAALSEGSTTGVVEIPNELNGDGFLATNSVMAMATALVRAHLPGERLDPDVTRLPDDPPTTLHDWILLTAPGLHSVAVDFETRLAELGVGTVQVVDYRNFAHGRHFGLDRRRNEVAVLALIGAPTEALAKRTIELLPRETPVVALRSVAPWPLSTLELLAQSIRLAARISEAAGVDPARPGVPEFGRRLYSLRLNGLLPTRQRNDPVERKLAALGGVDRESALGERLAESLQSWLARRSEEPLGALVLDYDGTVCHTHERFELPREDVRKELLRVLDEGLLIGFASGRGGSLHRDLRKWVPEHLWPRVLLGLYNGGVELLLADSLHAPGEIPGPLVEAAERLRAGILGMQLELDPRPHQLTVRTGEPMRDGTLATLVRETLERPPQLPLKITASAHSIDVIPAESTKVRVLRALEARCTGAVLAIGDQGQLGGNDFELLAATEASLSVDRCSADPSRCWNLGRTRHGPQLLVDYLRVINAGRFRWPRR
jgi:hypothetical protein